MDASKIHNDVTRDLIIRIIKPSASTSEAMVILESLVAGVLTACATLDRHNAEQRDSMLMALEDGVRKRLSKLPIET